MLNLTSEQQACVAVLRDSDDTNLTVQAVPGAGKTSVILHICAALNSSHTILILTYNRNLCDETRARLTTMGMDDSVACYTFHGLCTRHIGPAHDDAMLFDQLDRAETCTDKDFLPSKLHVDILIVDEVQDFRRSFERLLRLVVVPKRIVAVGDILQLLYNYDTEDPADPAYLSSPEKMFAFMWPASERQWKHYSITQTHRLTRQMALFVSRVFKVNSLHSINPTPSPFPVHVHTVNLFQSGPLLLKLLTFLRLLFVVYSLK